MLNKLNLSTNEDSPESGFDGIVQAIVCRDIIKWRAESRKILVYVSDDKFHVAGDGKVRTHVPAILRYRFVQLTRIEEHYCG